VAQGCGLGGDQGVPEVRFAAASAFLQVHAELLAVRVGSYRETRPSERYAYGNYEGVALQPVLEGWVRSGKMKRIT
jgi:hypothetical protein